MNRFGNLDGRHKLALIGAVICWGLSMYFSYLGFKVANTQMLWVGWIMAAVVTIVELAFNTPMHKLPLTLAVIGIICYIYGVVTNITGFWSLQHPGVPFVWFQAQSLMPIAIGFVMEVLPEPLFMWGLDVKVGGDLLGNIAGLWGGTLRPQSPDTGKENHSQPQSQNQNRHYEVPEAIRAAHINGKTAPKPIHSAQAGRPNPATYHKVTNRPDLLSNDEG